MRCPDCNKFVSYDVDVEPEEEQQDVTGTTFTATYRRTLTCQDCGTELKEGSIDLEYNFEADIQEATDASEPKNSGTAKPEHEHEWEIEECYVEATTDTKTTCVVKGKVKKITNPRYMTQLYGVSCDVTLKCGHDGCESTVNFTVSDTLEASGMDEMT